VKVYQYNKCSTCRKALKLLDAKDAKYRAYPIVEQPPSPAELKKMLSYLKADGGSLKNLFNTSGVQYRELGMAQKLKEGLSESEAIGILSKNGKLIKRPFILGKKGGVVGFKEDEISRLLD